MSDDRDSAAHDPAEEVGPHAHPGHTVETSVEAIIAELVEDEDAPVQRKDLARVVAATVQMRSGPLPSPEEMVQYDSIIPNGADRIMKQAEAEQQFRHAAHARQQALVEKVVDNDHDIAKRGQYFALSLSLAVLFLGGVFLFKGSPQLGASMVAAVIIGLAAVFLRSRSKEGSRTVSTDLMAPRLSDEHEAGEKP